MLLCVILIGDVINIRVAECHLVWDASDVLAGCENELEYKIRIFSGATYWTTVVNDRRNILVQTNSAIIIPADLPTSRPLRATVRIIFLNIVEYTQLKVFVCESMCSLHFEPLCKIYTPTFRVNYLLIHR